MPRFHIDDPDFDLEALEARVQAAIEAKLGTRFSAVELEQIRRAELRPRLRREDLPRGLPGQFAQHRQRLPEVEPPPPPEPLALSQVEPPPRQAVPAVDLAASLVRSDSGGIKGRLLGWLRRLARPVFRATLNLEHTLEALRDELAERADRGDDRVVAQVEQGFDRFKDNLDRRIDRAADWTGSHLSRMTGQLEQRRDREAHLLHNLVFELTDLRLDLRNLEDRIAEVNRRIAALEARERALEQEALPGAAGDGLP